jgi:hypothetical protein
VLFDADLFHRDTIVSCGLDARGRMRGKGRPPGKREDLGRVEEPRRIEDAFHAHLLVEIGRGVLVGHQVALLDADAMLAGQATADLDAELQDIGAGLLGLAELDRIVGIEQDQRMRLPSPAWKMLATLRP